MSRTLYTLRSQEKPSEPEDTDDIDLTDEKFILANDMKRYKFIDTLDSQRMIGYSSNAGLAIGKVMLSIKHITYQNFKSILLSFLTCI